MTNFPSLYPPLSSYSSTSIPMTTITSPMSHPILSPTWSQLQHATSAKPCRPPWWPHSIHWASPDQLNTAPLSSKWSPIWLKLPYWHHRLVLSWYHHQSSSVKVTSAKFQSKVSEIQRPGPIDQTSGTPGLEKNMLIPQIFEIFQDRCGFDLGSRRLPILTGWDSDLNLEKQTV